MNIESDAIVVNQNEQNCVELFNLNGHEIKWISMPECGIGLSRNTCLLNATSDIVLFADDDIVYHDDYVTSVISAFESTPDADLIFFNINLVNSNKNIGDYRLNCLNKRVGFFNSMRYGACVIAARRKAILRERVMFSLLFGGGAEFSSGEDTLFIKDCLDAGLRLYANTYCLGDVDDSSSSWYKGIDDIFFMDRGMVYSLAFPKIKKIIFTYYSIKSSKLTKSYSFSKIYSLYKKGGELIKKYR